MCRHVVGTFFGMGKHWIAVRHLPLHKGFEVDHLQYGLADPVVVNRILLWGIGSFFATVIVFGGVAIVFFEPGHPAVRMNTINIGISGSIASVAYGLAFFPPKAYLGWLRGDARGSADAL